VRFIGVAEQFGTRVGLFVGVVLGDSESRFGVCWRGLEGLVRESDVFLAASRLVLIDLYGDLVEKFLILLYLCFEGAILLLFHEQLLE
jgi:hypothetical protein